MDLFTQENKRKKILPPLAERMRPGKISDFIGQTALTAKDKILYKLFESRQIFSMILWGPPGSGKTTLAKLVSKYTNAKFFQLNAVSSGVKDVRSIIGQSEIRRRDGISTILFIDEIHRFNKAQQDALLHAVESGSIILIGATTENPSFEVISPLLSRCRVLKLSNLSESDLGKILDNAVNNDVVFKERKIFIEENAGDFLIKNVNGDARKLLNGMEIAQHLLPKDNRKITIDLIKEALQQKNMLYDKKADYHYDTISAFIKSVRGSDPDAAVYWLSVMIEGGEDPVFIARRLIILASEDVGNANPSALILATSGFQAVHSVGMPEAGIILTQCTTYIASSPKSNASYMSLNKAKAQLKSSGPPVVPLHLRNAPTKMMKEMDYGKNYKYSHDYDGHFVKENYFPENMEPSAFYEPTDIGREAPIKTRLEQWWPERYSKK